MTPATDPDTPLSELFRIPPATQKALAKLRIATVRDLFSHFPSRYQNIRDIKPIAALQKGDHAIVYGKVAKIATGKAFRKKIALAEATIADATGRIKVVWFRQPYIAQLVKEGASVQLTGTVTERSGALYFANPEIEVLQTLPSEILLAAEEATVPFIPVYPESRGVSSRWFYHHIQTLLKNPALETIEDPIPAEILKRYHLPSLRTALVWIHSPRKEADHISARKRFAFQEVFLIQLARLSQRAAYAEHTAYPVTRTKEHIDAFLERFPFDPTNAQQKAIASITGDLARPHPMVRLLEGDVGSGKTLVAAATAYAVVTTKPEDTPYTNLQVAYMAPTEILAQQHFESFIQYFSHLPIQIGLITGTECRKFPSKVDPSSHTHISRAQFLKWVADGQLNIIIGTHALVQKTVKFKDLAYAIIDEQHRFGVMQRMGLSRKSGGSGKAPHLLSMTATPIPRTLALTIFGDLDLTLLDEKPPGRKEIITEIVAPNDRTKIYEHIRAELAAGRQAYVICPRIDEPDPEKELAVNATSVVAETKRLKKEVFPEYEVGFVHSKMKPKEKEEVMEAFAKGSINILVATSVVEVGVNVPNATCIIIEGAERFGLAQLHQLRGRVLRSSHQAYCYLFSESKAQTSLKRLKALATAKNGFELAELDLELRGAGELSGLKQSGLSDIGMEALKNLKMVEAARQEAHTLLADDPELVAHPLLAEVSHTNGRNMHFE